MKHPKVYKRSLEEALQKGETDLFHKNTQLNSDCISAIDKAVIESNYELYRYDLKSAAATVISEFGEERLSWVLSGILQDASYDGRYSNTNKDWANSFDIHHGRWTNVFPNTHPTVLDGLVDRLREMLPELKKKPSIIGELKTATSSKQDTKADEPKKRVDPTL